MGISCVFLQTITRYAAILRLLGLPDHNVLINKQYIKFVVKMKGYLYSPFPLKKQLFYRVQI